MSRVDGGSAGSEVHSSSDYIRVGESGGGIFFSVDVDKFIQSGVMLSTPMPGIRGVGMSLDASHGNVGNGRSVERAWLAFSDAMTKPSLRDIVEKLKEVPHTETADGKGVVLTGKLGNYFRMKDPTLLISSDVDGTVRSREISKLMSPEEAMEFLDVTEQVWSAVHNTVKFQGASERHVSTFDPAWLVIVRGIIGSIKKYLPPYYVVSGNTSNYRDKSIGVMPDGEGGFSVYQRGTMGEWKAVSNFFDGFH